MSAASQKTQMISTAARIAVADLERFVAVALRMVGVGEGDASTVARALATTDSWGTFTHGVKCLPGYVRRLEAGGLRATSSPRVVAEGPAWAMIDGDSALGAVTSVAAMERAMAKASIAGIAYVGVRNSCHFGAAGYYAALAASRGMIGLAMANDHPSMAVPGARGRVLGNNPFAFAAPTGGPDELVMMLDIALSTVAGGKLMAAQALGQRIPADWSIDREGRPTTDPKDFLEGGALTPMGGHKGYGFGMLVETLSAALTGAETLARVAAWMVHDQTRPTGHGAAFIAIDIAAIAGREAFAQRMAQVVADIRRAPLAPHSERIWLPGEMEWERRQRALREGIVLPPDVVAAARALAEHLGIDLDRDLTAVPTGTRA
jgi:LDH2 family malate/lactate/ureidoglycolate dehydrogenase